MGFLRECAITMIAELHGASPVDLGPWELPAESWLCLQGHASFITVGQPE